MEDDIYPVMARQGQSETLVWRQQHGAESPRGPTRKNTARSDLRGRQVALPTALSLQDSEARPEPQHVGLSLGTTQRNYTNIQRDKLRKH